MSTDAQRRTYDADPEHVEVREPTDTDDGDGLFRVRMPVTSTAEARDGEAFGREKVRGFRDQIAESRVPVFLDHGHNEQSGSRYSALGKVGYLDAPELVERNDTTDLDADFVLVDPAELDADVGWVREALAWIRSQAELGVPLASSVGWKDDTGDRDLPGGADLLETSIVGIPSDARTTTADAGTAEAMARAVDAAAEGFDRETFLRELARDRQLDEDIVDAVGADLLTPRSGAAEAARQALDWREAHPEEFALSSSDGEGLRRAAQLVDHADRDAPLDGENSEGTPYWEEIVNFHARHHSQGNHELDGDFAEEPWRDAGYVAHLAWGGDAGYEQAQEVADAIAAAENTTDEDEEAVDAPTTTTDSTAATHNLDDPAFGDGDAVMWSWQGEPVHGRVADVGAEFTVDGTTITGAEGEAVYLIHEWDEAVEAFRPENVAKPQSSLDESTMDLPAATEETMTDDSDTEPDAESGTDTDEQRADMKGMLEQMVDMQEEQTAMIREMYENEMGSDDGEDDDMEENDADAADTTADDGEAAAEDDERTTDDDAADDSAERTVTLNGDERAIDDALAELREAAAEADVSESRTTDVADDADATDDEQAETGFGFTGAGGD